MRRLVSLALAGILSLIAPGLSASEQATLQHAGAFGHHPIRMLLLGDSIALTLGVGLDYHAHARYGVTISNHSTLGCDLDTLEIFTSGKPGPATPGCAEWRALWPFLTAAEQPDVVALGVGRWEISDHFYDGRWVHIGQKVWDDHVAHDLRDAIAIFRLFGAKVVLLTMPYIEPSDRQADGQPWAENTVTRARLYNQLLGRVARSDPRHVSVVDLNKLLSPAGVYTPVVHGVTVRWSDGIHVTTAGGEYLQPSILPLVDRLGLAAEPAVAQAVAKATAVSRALVEKHHHT
jgi:hypothetical protein